MSTKTINQSKDYSQFVSHPYQQPMSERHVLRIMDSMKNNGFLQSKPISVVRSDGKLVIVDGHHRFNSAKELGLPVFYVVEDRDCMDIIGELNNSVRRWANASFANMYARQGMHEYVTLLSYVEKGIPLRCAASLLNGESAHSGNAGRLVRNGSFRVKTRKHIDQIVTFLDEFGESIPVVNSQLFIEALALLLWVPEFSVETMRVRLRNNPRLLQPCNNRPQMLTQLEEIYNFRSRERINLAFQAQELATKRQAAHLGK